MKDLQWKKKTEKIQKCLMQWKVGTLTKMMLIEKEPSNSNSRIKMELLIELTRFLISNHRNLMLLEVNSLLNITNTFIILIQLNISYIKMTTALSKYPF